MPEQQNIEYKESWKDEYLKWVCGFANSMGGKLYVGIDDKGKVKGVENFSELLEQLPNKFRDLLGVHSEINLLSEDNKWYLEIVIPRYDVPISWKGMYYSRSGSTMQELRGSALTEFLLRKVGKTWEDIIEPAAKVSDMDESSIARFLRDVKKGGRMSIDEDITTSDLLEKLRLSEQGQIKRAAVVLFGKNPGKFYHSFSVKIGRFGKSDADLRFQEVVEGNLIQLLERVPEILNSKFLIQPIDFEGLQRVEREEYPVAALREALLNALVHRNYMGAQTQIRVYDGFISIWNDGDLPSGITIETLKQHHPSKPRNPIIADASFKAGYIDSWGRGTIKILEACAEAQLPEPEMAEVHGGFQVVLFKYLFIEGQSNKPELNVRQLKAIVFVKNNGSITNQQYQASFEVSARTSSRDLNELVSLKLLNKQGDKKGASYTLPIDSGTSN